MKQKWIVIMLCMVVVASIIVGCGKDKSKNTTKLEPSTEPKNTTTVESSTEPKDDVIASGNGTGGEENSPSYNEKGEITSFAYVDKEEAPDKTKVISEKDYKIEDCITLPDLTSMKVVCPMDKVTKEDAEGYFRSNLDAKPLTDENVTAKKWDRLTIDYTTSYKGRMLNEEGIGRLAIIGSFGLPKKIEESLIGHKVGDEFKVDVEFPDTYEANTFYVGKKITYHIKVNGIARTKDPSEKEIEETQISMQQNIERGMPFIKYQATAKHIEDNATFHAYPKKYLEEARIAYELGFISSFGSVSAYAKEKGMTVDTVKKQEDDWIIPLVRRRVVTEAVAKELGVSKESEEYRKKQAECKYTDDEYENLLYTALDKIINEIEYVAQ